MLYDAEGSPLPHAYWLAAEYEMRNNHLVGAERNVPKGIEYMETAFENDSLLKRKNLTYYAYYKGKEGKAEFLQQQIEDLLGKGLKTETDYNILSTLYRYGGLPEQQKMAEEMG